MACSAGILRGSVDRPGGVDETDMCEDLGEVAEQSCAVRGDLLGEQAHVVGAGGEPWESTE